MDAARADAYVETAAGDDTDGPASFLLRHGWMRSGALLVRSL
jgi:hypothetical protein